MCLGTLGPGATNLVTGLADAFLDHAPVVALTGQGDLQRTHKESHQYIDIVSLMRPIVKWNTTLTAPQIIPEAVRKAFKVAQAQKPGPTHLELPEDVMGAPLDAEPLNVRSGFRRPSPARRNSSWPPGSSARPTTRWRWRGTGWRGRASTPCAISAA